MVSDRCRCKNCICEENIFVIFVNSNLIDFNVQGLLPVSFPISNFFIAKDTRLITLNIMVKKTKISKTKVSQVEDDTVLFKFTLKLSSLNHEVHVPFPFIMEHCIIMHAWQRIFNGFSLSVTFIFLSLYDIIMY